MTVPTGAITRIVTAAGMHSAGATATGIRLICAIMEGIKMARDHGRIQTAIWRDPEFRALSGAAQSTYFTCLSQESLTYAGVLDYFPGRIANLSKDGTEAKVERAVKELEAARFLVVDRTTAELLIRSFVRHDGVLDRENMGKATVRALVKVISLPIRSAIQSELARLYQERPGLSGWKGFAALHPEELAMVTAMASQMELPMTSGVA